MIRGHEITLKSGWKISVAKTAARKSITLFVSDPDKPTVTEAVGYFRDTDAAAKFVRAFAPEREAEQLKGAFSGRRQ